MRRARDRLVARVRSGRFGPGERFLSNRAAAELLQVSYQTADRLLRQLVAQGLLVRRAGSGTYLPGTACPLTGVALLLHHRARRKGSFGARLAAGLLRGLRDAGIETRVRFLDPARPVIALAEHWFPVLWELPLQAAALASRRAMLINQRPPAGLRSLGTDSASLDDYSGGASAAQLLSYRASQSHPCPPTPRPPRLAVLAGPADDLRSQSRVAGFLSVAPAKVIAAGGWFTADGHAVAGEVLAAGSDGVFCCNDRLAEGLLRHARAHRLRVPRLVGFDDAPVAERLDLTTMAITWSALTRAVVDVASRRLRGDDSVSSHLILPTTPIFRATCPPPP